MSEEKIVIKQGYPYSAMTYGYAVFLVVGACLVAIKFEGLPTLLSIPLFVLGLYLFVVRREFILDLENDRFKSANSFLGMKLGNWSSIADIKGITIKYTILTDKRKNQQYGGILPVAIFDLARSNPNQYNKDETWLVHIFDATGNSSRILNTGKTEALTALIHILNKNKEAKPYLAHYRKDYELKKAALSQGKLELVTPKPKRGKYY